LNLARGRSHPRLVEYWTWGGAFLITVLLFILLTRIALHAIQRSQDLLQLEKRGHSIEANYVYNINKLN
jgi:type II secretory pathway component PulM